jgi:hypothetical protein
MRICTQASSPSAVTFSLRPILHTFTGHLFPVHGVALRAIVRVQSIAESDAVFKLALHGHGLVADRVSCLG